MPYCLSQMAAAGSPAAVAGDLYAVESISRQIVSLHAAASVAQNPLGGRSDWGNAAQAVGSNESDAATLNGSLVGARCGELELSFAAPAGKTGLTLAQVQLRFVLAQAGTVFNNGSLSWGVIVNGVYTALGSATGDLAKQALSYDISALVGGDWSKAGVKAIVRGTLAAGASSVLASCYAVLRELVCHDAVAP